MSRLYQPYPNRRVNSKLQFDDDQPEYYESYLEQRQQQPNIRSRLIPPQVDIRKMSQHQHQKTELDASTNTTTPSPNALANLLSALGSMEFTLNCGMIIQYLTYSLCVFVLIMWLFPDNILFILLTIMILFLSIIRYLIYSRQRQLSMAASANDANIRIYNMNKLEKLRAQMNQRMSSHTAASNDNKTPKSDEPSDTNTGVGG